MITAHTDVVGSLLRPAYLLKAREDRAAGRLTPAEFKGQEDQAVDEAVALQAEAGIDVVTDGEQRRLSFQSQLLESVEGIGEWTIDAFLWGDWKGDERVGDKSTPRPRELGVVGKLRRKRHLSAEEFVYLRSRTAGTRLIPKITLTSPSLYANLWSAEKSTAAYPTLDSFLADVVDILRDEVAELARLGCEYIQIDAPHYPLLIDPATRAFYDEYSTVMDLPADFYLETVDRVFQRQDLAHGSFRVNGVRVDPGAIEESAQMTVEGERDDICAVGQTVAAHRLCRNLAAAKRTHHLQRNVGHYGVFHGRRWQSETYPKVRDFIRAHG